MSPSGASNRVSQDTERQQKRPYGHFFQAVRHAIVPSQVR